MISQILDINYISTTVITEFQGLEVDCSYRYSSSIDNNIVYCPRASRNAVLQFRRGTFLLHIRGRESTKLFTVERLFSTSIYNSASPMQNSQPVFYKFQVGCLSPLATMSFAPTPRNLSCEIVICWRRALL